MPHPDEDIQGTLVYLTVPEDRRRRSTAMAGGDVFSCNLQSFLINKE
jgi:hypothetical protein